MLPDHHLGLVGLERVPLRHLCPGAEPIRGPRRLQVHLWSRPHLVADTSRRLRCPCVARCGFEVREEKPGRRGTLAVAVAGEVARRERRGLGFGGLARGGEGSCGPETAEGRVYWGRRGG